MFAEVSVCVSPCGAVRDDVVGTCCTKLGDHQGRCGRWHDDSAAQVQGTSRMHSSEASIAATGSEDVWLTASRKLLKAAEDIVANSSGKSLA